MSDRLAIRIAKYNQSGIVVTIESSEGCDSVDLVRHTTKRNVKAACDSAIAKLERLIENARALSEHEDPFKCDVQDKINGWKLWD